MDVEFQVIRNGETIFAHAFRVYEPEHFAEASSKALTAFRMQHPNVSLLHDVVMRWAMPEEAGMAAFSAPTLRQGVTHAAIF